MSWPSPRERPARIASRISGVTYLPNVSFTISRSRSPCSMRLKPSATAPISSVLTTVARPSSRPCSTSAIAASTSRSGAATLLAAKIESPMAASDPHADQEHMVTRRPSMTLSAVAASAPSSPRARM